MKLSANFILEELCCTDTGIDNIPTDIEIDHLKLLCVYILQPIRDEFGGIGINSGYRCESVNNAVGGVKASQHLKGQAADIKPFKATLMDVYRWILDSLQFGTCIIYPERHFIHISLPRLNKGNNQALVCINGEYEAYSGGRDA